MRVSLAREARSSVPRARVASVRSRVIVQATPSGSSATVDARVALKEWNVVCDALRRGEQIALARKGGIDDAPGVFELRSDTFALFPTNFHADIAGVEAPRAGEMKAGESVACALVCRATRTWRVRPEAAEACFERMAAASGWPVDLFAKRANWKPTCGVTVVEVRAYACEPLILAPDVDRFGGCKSWVDIDPWAFGKSARAVLSDEAFAAKSAALAKDMAELGAIEMDVSDA